VVAIFGVTMVAVAAAPASAANVRPQAACDPIFFYQVDRVGNPWYSSIGSAVGKYNSSTSTSTLSITLSQTTSRSTAWEVSGSVSVGWGIAKIEASTSYTVTNTTSTGVSVTDTISVAGHHYGYAQPKVEYRKFHIRYMQGLANCNVVTNTDYGYMDAITAYPFFSECTATAACTPTP